MDGAASAVGIRVQAYSWKKNETLAAATKEALLPSFRPSAFPWRDPLEGLLYGLRWVQHGEACKHSLPSRRV